MLSRLLRLVWHGVNNWFVPEPTIYPVASTPRRVPEPEMISGRCWCGDQVIADTSRGWVDAILLHYRERHPDDEAGQRLADDPDRYSREERFQPKQW